MDDLMKLARQAKVWSGPDQIAEFARLIRAGDRERCISAIREQMFVGSNETRTSALRDAEDAIRELED